MSIFIIVDPLAEKFYSISPYVYCYNNPLKFIDPTGKDGIITIQNDSIIINVSIILYGKDATNQAVNNIQNDIDKNWSKKADGSNWTYTDPATGKVYTTVFNVSVSLLNGKEKQRGNMILDSWNPSSRNNYIEIDNSIPRDYVIAGDEGVWGGNRRQVPSHEFGHLLGLKNRYSEYRGKTSTNPGWVGNMMADNVAVDQRNINGVVSEAVTSYNIMKQTTAISSRYPRVPGRRRMPSIYTYQINSFFYTK